MEINKLLTDDSAVSPVIGVILMVAITVILAAVIGTFVLGLGDQVQDNAPQASFTFDYDESGTALTITHDGGDKIDSDRMTITDGSSSTTWTEQVGGTAIDVNAGNQITVGDGGTGDYAVSPGATVRIVWESSGGGNSATLGKWTGPDA